MGAAESSLSEKVDEKGIKKEVYKIF